MSLATPGDWIVLVGMLISIYLNLSQAQKNRADTQKTKSETKNDEKKSEVDLTKMLTEAAANLVKPLNDRIDDLEEINKKKDLEIARLGTRITDLEKQVRDLKKENDLLKNCGE